MADVGRTEGVGGRPGWANRAQALARERREDWLSHSVLSGFAATFAMTLVLAIGYGLAKVVGHEDGSRLTRWFWALAHNEATRQATDTLLLAVGINVLMGLLWAMVYARFVEPVLSGPGWRKGMLFSLIPWLLSIIVFLPLLGADIGFLGRGIDAGPLPVLGNSILHGVYGAVLGAIYAIALEAGLDDPETELGSARAAERGAALGIGIGVLLGGVIGWIFGPQLSEYGSRSAVALGVALLGAAIGIMLGSLLGIGRSQRPV